MQDPCFGEGSLFVWGWAPMFYTETRLPAASRFILVGFSLVGYVSGNRDPGAGDGLADPQPLGLAASRISRGAARPTCSTPRPRDLGRWGFPLEGDRRLAAFVAASYEPLDVVDHVRLYRRRDCGRPW